MLLSAPLPSKHCLLLHCGSSFLGSQPLALAPLFFKLLLLES